MMRMYHIAASEKDIGEYAILTGDPKRVEEIAGFLENPEFVAQNREYTTWRGVLEGKTVNVMSVGIGGPSMAIGVEELYKLGCRNFIRVGTCGGIDLKVKAGDLVIANAAVRQEGTGIEYLPVIFPAVSDFDMTAAIKASAVENGFAGHMHIGVVQSKDSFYGEMEPERMPEKEKLRALWDIYKKTGVLASEMECAALFLTAMSLGARAGAVLLAIWNKERENEMGDGAESHDTSVMYKVAVDAVRECIRNSNNKV